MSKKCYVKVINNINNESYDVGPFIYSGNDSFSESESAIDWIYKQIGLIKVNNPDATLVKHRWNYKNDDFMGISADVKIEIDGFIFEIFELVDQRIQYVINESVEENNIPPGFQ